nr:efflux RND transporter permease subunit [uncultured Criibacterium sp.]
MDIVKTSIKRPITIIMGMLIILILGGVSVSKMKMSLMPEFKLPYVIVYSTYEGAGPNEVENLLSKPLEQAVSSVHGVNKITSQSSNGMSILEIELSYGTNMDKAVSDIGEAINMIQDFLPDEASKPVAMKLNLDMMPIAFVVASSGKMDDYQLRDFVDRNIKNRIERLDGVASVTISGGTEKEIRVFLDENKLNGLKLDVNTISQLIMSENTDLAGGNIDFGEKSFSVSSKLQMDSIEDIKNTPIILRTGNVIKLQEIADVALVDKKLTTKSRYNKNSAVMLAISKSSDGNTVDTVKNLREEIKNINKSYDNLNVVISQESAKLIENSISSVVQNIFVGAFLSILILMVFLKNIGLTTIIALSMPFSIIGTFVFLYFSGTTLNMVSLGGLSIGVGMLVDNSIVVLENIYRYRTTLKFDKVRGTYLATSEVKTAIIASTLTTLVVFLPFVFATGIVIQLMKDLALAVVFSLTMSLITALTIVPMMSANYVNSVHRNKAKKLLFINKLLDAFDRFIKWLTFKYDKVLAWCLDRKKRTLLFALGFFIFSLFLTPFIGKEFLPGTDEGEFSITIEPPKGSNIEYIDNVAKRVEDILYSYKEVVNVNTTVSAGQSSLASIFSGGSGTGTIKVTLVNKNKRAKGIDDIIEEIRQKTNNIAGAKIKAQKSQSIMGGATANSYDISMYIHGDDQQILQQLSDEITGKLKKVNGLRQVTSSLDAKESQVSVKINKEKTRFYGLTGVQVANQVRNNVSGTVATKLKHSGTETDVRLALPMTTKANFDSLSNIKITTPIGTTIPLVEVSDITTEKVPSDVFRADSTRFTLISAGIYGIDFGTATAEFQKVIDDTKFPSGYYATMGEETKMMTDTFSSLALVVLLAIVLVYMVMASQFESLINPFVIMFTVPLAFSGGIILLFLFRATMSVMSIIGGLVLVGIVVNNGIVLIDYINTLRFRDGLDIKTAVRKACPTRLRPILMTALTTILGQVPLVFSNSANSETMKGMGLVIAGGLATSTVLTLVIVPIIYMIFDNITEKFKSKFNLRGRENSFEIEELVRPITKEEIDKMEGRGKEV